MSVAGKLSGQTLTVSESRLGSQDANAGMAEKHELASPLGQRDGDQRGGEGSGDCLLGRKAESKPGQGCSSFAPLILPHTEPSLLWMWWQEVFQEEDNHPAGGRA